MQLYVSDVDASVPVPIRQLQGFTRVRLQPGESREVSFTLAPEQMVCTTDDGRPLIEPGRFQVSIGGGQPVPGTHALPFVTGSFEVT